MKTKRQEALIIFIKNPIKGTVKTRLAKDAGDDKALEIYQELLVHTRHITTSLKVDKLLYYSNNIEGNDEWSNDIYQKNVQVIGGLGEKMMAAFQEAFEAGYQKVVIIGSDCIALDSNILQDAFRQLDTNDFVIGPTFDGGYYLIGMKTLLSDVFIEKKWSTESVFPDTLADLQKTQKSYFLLPQLSDIDYLEDWQKHKNKKTDT
ncbi:MAG: TIGR04282 family arsenosugar biosynthesis glycosyltransferase [Chitinophagales bacterium]